VIPLIRISSFGRRVTDWESGSNSDPGNCTTNCN
jgi:hypothetical protein